MAEKYKRFFPESESSKDEATKLSLAILGKRVWEDVGHNRLTQVVFGGLVVATAARIAEAHGIINPTMPVSGDFTIFLDNLLKWSGSNVKQPVDLLSLLNAVGSAAVYVGVPAKAVEIISAIQGRITTEKVKKQSEELKARTEKEQAIKDGVANFDGKVGPNIQIDVGRSDPSMSHLLSFFNNAGIPVVSYWDQQNGFFDRNPAWQKTDNDWTNKDTLMRGDAREALASIILVSNGDDVFLSTRKQDPIKKIQDMTDNEAIGSIHARDDFRRKLGLPEIQHFLVTNSKRTVGLGIGREGEAPYVAKTISEVVGKMENVHLIDPDTLIINEISRIASQKGLPIELLTNEERTTEYQENLKLLVAEHNKDSKENELRIATDKDGKNTMTLVYGSTDEDTVAQVTTYGSEFAKEGILVAIINDPEKASRLPEGTQFICVGRIVAEAVYQEFYEQVANKKIEI